MYLFRFSTLAILFAAQITLTAGPCERDAAECTAPPAGQLVAFLETAGAAPSVRLQGVVGPIAAPDNDGFRKIPVRIGGGDSTAVIRFQAGDVDLPLTVGKVYEFNIEYIGGWPAASSLVVNDEAGLVFAGATDQSIGGHVLKEGLPGFDFRLEPTGCPSREKTNCYDAIINSLLNVSHSGRSVALWNGQAARLGAYRVSCLTAQKIDYNNNCADAGLPAVSWVVSREDSTAVR